MELFPYNAQVLLIENVPVTFNFVLFHTHEDNSRIFYLYKIIFC